MSRPCPRSTCHVAGVTPATPRRVPKPHHTPTAKMAGMQQPFGRITPSSHGYPSNDHRYIHRFISSHSSSRLADRSSTARRAGRPKDQPAPSLSPLPSHAPSLYPDAVHGHFQNSTPIHTHIYIWMCVFVFVCVCVCVCARVCIHPASGHWTQVWDYSWISQPSL
jgi:hypothetical protein